MKRMILLATFLWGMTIVLQAQLLKVSGLSCEYLTNPVGIDTQSPVFGWKIEADERGQLQSAYEILVATDENDLTSGKRLLWKSGKKVSAKNVDVRYEGPKLKPFTRYYWKVRVANQDDRLSDWSEPAYWETAMLKPADWQARWIWNGEEAPQKEEEFYRDEPAPLFRKTFQSSKPLKAARLYIAGLGYYEVSMNGERVGDQVLEPGWTNFNKQILYGTYDITSLLRSGENAIGVMLGNGFYNPLPMRVFKPLREFLSIGRPCLKAQIRLEYTDGSIETIVTDESWTTAPGPVLRNNVYIGEHYDARREQNGWNTVSFDAADWTNARLQPDAPAGRLTARMQPPVRATKVFKPVRVAEVRPGEFVFDMGQNFAGVVRLKVKGPAGTTVKVRYGEDIYSDGSLNVMTSVAGQQKKIWNADWSQPGQPQTVWQEDRYTLKGTGTEVWSPRFTFHGFRYVEVTGWPGRPALDDIEGVRLNADLPRTGSFECSDPMLNKLHTVLDYTFLSNVFSVQSDCPAREKFGYGGDIVGVARAFCWFYDMENFYRKAIHDFANDQRPEGGMTETAPYNGIADNGLGDGSGPIGWQLAFAFMQKQLYDYYGDLQTIRSFYPVLVKQVEFLRSKANGNKIEDCINDHESLEPRIPALFATAHYYHHVLLLAEFASLLNKPADAKTYTELSDEIKQAFIKQFVKPGVGLVGNGTQSAQAFALYYNLHPTLDKKGVLDGLLRAIEKQDGHIASGIFGVPAILNVLRENDRNDVAYAMVTQKTFPGWGHMLENGATTLWETWKYSDNVYSQNHPMFGSVGEWMYQSLGGINPAGPGFSRVILKPQPVEGLDWVNCRYQSVNGEIVSNWKKANGTFTWQVRIPVNTVATVCIPASEAARILESGSPVEKVRSIQVLGYKNGYMCLKAGSGEYSFTVD